MLNVGYIQSFRTHTVSAQIRQSANNVVPLRHDLSHLATVQSILSVISIALSVLQAEIAWHTNFDDDEFDCRRGGVAVTPTCAAAFEPIYPFESGLSGINAVRWVGTVATFCLLVTVFLHHELVVQYLQARGAFSPRASPCSGAWPEDAYFVLEMVLCAVHVPPHLERLTSSAPVFLCLTLFPLVRLYTIFRAYHHKSFLTKAVAKFIGAVTLVRFDAPFVVKTWLAVRPVVASLVCGVGFVCGMAYSVRIVESVECVNDLYSLCDPMSFLDSLWLVMTTVTTVGYGGDVVPFTRGGQVVVFIGAGLGVLLVLVSLAVAVVMLNPSSSEADVLHLLRTLDRRQRLRNAAASCIQATWRYQGGFRSSLQWRTGRFGTQYRVVSQRIPLEVHAARVVSKFRQLRWRFRRDELNMEPSVALTMEMMMLDLKASEVVTKMKALTAKLKQLRGVVPKLRPPFPSAIPNNHIGPQQSPLATITPSPLGGSRSNTPSKTTPNTTNTPQ